MATLATKTVKEKFSKNLFWDVDVSQLDVDANRRYVIGRVLDRGADNDLRLAFSYYTFPVVVEVAKSLRTLENLANLERDVLMWRAVK